MKTLTEIRVSRFLLFRYSFCHFSYFILDNLIDIIKYPQFISGSTKSILKNVIINSLTLHVVLLSVAAMMWRNVQENQYPKQSPYKRETSFMWFGTRVHVTGKDGKSFPLC